MTAPGLPSDVALYPELTIDSPTGPPGWRDPDVSDEEFVANGAFVAFTWDDQTTTPGSSDLAGAQFQIAEDSSMTVNVRQITSPTISNSLFQFGPGVVPFGQFGEVTPNNIYYCRMRVRNGNFLSSSGFLNYWNENTSVGVYGPWTPATPVRVGLVVPEPPTSVTVNSFFAGSALLAFTPATQKEGVLPVTGFLIEYSKSATFASGVSSVTVGPDINNRLFTGLDQGDEYFFRVFAINDDGNSDPSSTESVTIEVSAFPIESKIISPGTYGPVFYSLTGHVAGFGTDGKFRRGVETDLDYEVRLYTPTASSYSIVGDKVYARSVTTDTLYFVPNPNNPSLSSLNAIRFKTLLGGEDCSVTWFGNPSFPSLYGGKNFSIVLDYSAKTLTATSEYSNNGSRVTTTDTTSLSGINLDEEVTVTVQYQRVTITDPVTGEGSFEYDLMVSVCPANDYTSPATVLLAYEADSKDAVTQRVLIDGKIRSLCVSNDHRELGLSEVFEYEREPEYTIDGTFELAGPVPSLIGNVWEYIQDGCAASRAEVNVVDNKPAARNIGSRILDITNVAPQPNITPTTAFAGQAIDVSHTNASLLTQGLFYYSKDDNNRIFSADFGEDITTTVEAPGSPTFLQQPILVSSTQYLSYVEAGSFPFSVYGVIDSTGLPIVPAQWADYEGLVEVSINTDIPNAIDVRMKGPREQIPGTTGPYSISYSAGGGVDFGALALVGSGVLFEKETVQILTGAPTDRVTKITGTNIDNPFVNTLEQAYDLGATAADIAAGPNVTLTGTIPVSAIEGFGFVAGSLIRYRDNIYRVREASIGNLSVEFTATEYVTVGQFDELWGDIDVGVHDALWGDNQVQDQKIFPFREVGYPQT